MKFKEGDYIQGQINQNLDISFSIEFNVFIKYIKKIYSEVSIESEEELLRY